VGEVSTGGLHGSSKRRRWEKSAQEVYMRVVRAGGGRSQEVYMRVVRTGGGRSQHRRFT